MENSSLDSLPFAPADFALDRGSPLPLYVQVRSRLLSMVLAWPDPERQFPTEAMLTEMFGVSRVTVRGALAELSASGYLTRRRGAGTRVKAHKIEEKLALGRRLKKKWLSGEAMRVSVLSFGLAPAPAEVAAALRLRKNTPVLTIQRMRATKLAPVAVDWRYVPEKYAGAIRQTDASGGIFEAVSKSAAMARADMELEGHPAAAEESELLLVPPGTLLLAHRFTVFDPDEHPVMAGRTTARADLTRYAVKMDLTPEAVG